MCARHCRHRRPALSAHGLSRPQPSHSATQVSIPQRKPLCSAAHSGCRRNRSRPGHLHTPAVLLFPNRYSYMPDFGTSSPPGDEQARHRYAAQIPHLQQARLAQSAERKALNLVVVGSSPTVGAMCARHCRHRRPALSAHGLSRPQPSHSATQVSIPQRKPLCWAAHSGCRRNRSRPGHLHKPAVLLSPIDIALCLTLELLCPPETKRRATDMRRRFRICNKPA